MHDELNDGCGPDPGMIASRDGMRARDPWEMEQRGPSAAIKQFRMIAKEYDRVRYIPLHAKGDPEHPDCEDGTISSFSATSVFVKFDKQMKKFGWDGTTSQSCDPTDLKVL